MVQQTEHHFGVIGQAAGAGQRFPHPALDRRPQPFRGQLGVMAEHLDHQVGGQDVRLRLGENTVPQAPGTLDLRDDVLSWRKHQGEVGPTRQRPQVAAVEIAPDGGESNQVSEGFGLQSGSRCLVFEAG